MRRVASIGVVLAGLVGLSVQAAPVIEPQAVRAGLHPGFGRLVIEWPTPATVTAEAQGDRLYLTFEHPFEEDLTPQLAELKGYMLGFAPGEGRRQVMLLLAPGVHPSVFSFDRYVVIDFYRAQGSRPLVPVRTGRHGQIDRIVFDWPDPVGFRLSGQGGRLSLEFDRSVRIDSQAIVGALTPRVRDAWVESDGRHSRLILLVAPDLAASAYRLDEDPRRVLLDLAPAGAGPDHDVVPASAGSVEPHDPTS